MIIQVFFQGGGWKLIQDDQHPPYRMINIPHYLSIEMLQSPMTSQNDDWIDDWKCNPMIGWRLIQDDQHPPTPFKKNLNRIPHPLTNIAATTTRRTVAECKKRYRGMCCPRCLDEKMASTKMSGKGP